MPWSAKAQSAPVTAEANACADALNKKAVEALRRDSYKKLVEGALARASAEVGAVSLT